VGDAVRAALASGRPAVIEIPIDPDEFPTPATQARKPAAR
jgi:thiamine pyrophosphate-dependent acetolactate synthase large subunit-like protein